MNQTNLEVELSGLDDYYLWGSGYFNISELDKVMAKYRL